jgi:hypothetical protein
MRIRADVALPSQVALRARLPTDDLNERSLLPSRAKPASADQRAERVALQCASARMWRNW